MRTTSLLLVETPLGVEIHFNGLPCGIVAGGKYTKQKYVNHQTGEPYELGVGDRMRQSHSDVETIRKFQSAFMAISGGANGDALSMTPNVDVESASACPPATTPPQ